MAALEILEGLKKSILEYDSEGAVSWAKKAVEEKVDPIKALDALTEAIRKVGDGYGRGELWLPELICAAEAMSRAMPIIEEEIKKAGKERKAIGSVVIGTVKGDIHSIGKTMVSTLLAAEGFIVYDLGVDVPAEAFIDAVKKYKPDLLCMSALLTMTAPEQREVIETLKEEGLREKVKVMVGGGAITEEFAEMIRADGYSPTAAGGPKLARKLIGK